MRAYAPLVLMPTVSLRRFEPAPLALEVRPLARLEAGGRLVPETAAWLPAEGPAVLILWQPGPHEPAFSHVEGTLRRVGAAWLFEGPEAAGWVVHHLRSAQGPRHKV